MHLDLAHRLLLVSAQLEGPIETSFRLQHGQQGHCRCPEHDVTALVFRVVPCTIQATIQDEARSQPNQRAL